MKRFSILLICLMTSVLPLHLAAQSAPRAVEGFESENAILDTSLPFAIGAREARQSLRGAFGWPTFQEGLVEGVYFRFDPDGYARFSPSPRLDSDVFEVICRPRTFSCFGRKEGFSVALTGRGQLQLKFDDVVNGDTFHVSEGVSEIQLPERVLQPLDAQLETLLSTGGDLIIRRGGEETANISLRGFSAVSAYLKWILARQDYTVLPRGWPVPNSKYEEANSGMTRPADWASPMPQPQVLVDAGAGAVTPSVASAVLPGTGAGASEDVADLRAELKLLREILLTQNGGAGSGVAGNAPSDRVRVDMEVAERLATLQSAAEDIRREIEGLQLGGAVETGLGPAEARQGVLAPTVGPGLDPNMVSGIVPSTQTLALGLEAGLTHGGRDAVVPAPLSPGETQALTSVDTPQDFSTRLVYLIEEVGLSPEVALSVLRSVEEVPATGGRPAAVLSPVSTPLYQGSDVVSQILQELEADMGIETAETASEADVTPPEPRVNAREYQLLSDYFKSVVVPELQP